MNSKRKEINVFPPRLEDLDVIKLNNICRALEEKIRKTLPVAEVAAVVTEDSEK